MHPNKRTAGSGKTALAQTAMLPENARRPGSTCPPPISQVLACIAGRETVRGAQSGGQGADIRWRQHGVRGTPITNSYQNLTNIVLRIAPRALVHAKAVLINAHFDTVFGTTGAYAHSPGDGAVPACLPS